MPNLYQRNGIWYVVAYRDGRKVRTSTHERDREKALEHLNDGVTLSVLRDRFLALYSNRHTLHRYRLAFDHFIRVVGDKRLKDLREEDMISMVNHCRLTQHDPTVYGHWRALRCAFHWGRRWY